ncbi:MAG: CHAT domain-containing protein [Pseudonocardiaceae bacterium]
MSDDSSSELLLRAGEAYRRVVADPTVFGPQAAQLVAQARAAGDPAALVPALRAEAWFERIRLAHGRARVLLDEAIRTARKHHLDALLGQVLVTRGAVNHELGRLIAARRDFGRAAQLIGPEMATELAAQQAALYQNTGRLSEASVLYRRILADPGTPPEVGWKAANNLGIIEAECGHPESALAYFGAAAVTAEEMGPAVVAFVAGTRAWVTVQAGRLTEGLHLFEEATHLWTAAGLPLGELYAEYADALMDLRLIPEATERAQLAVEMFERQGVTLMAAEAQLRAARLAQLRQDLRVAETAAETAAARLRRQGRPSWAARARLIAIDGRLQLGTSRAADLPVARRAAATLARAGMSAGAVEAYLSAGRVAAALGHPDAALSTWTRAYELSRGAPVLVRVKGRVAAALASRLRRQHDRVLEHSRAGLNDLAQHRAALASTELRALASGHGAELGGLGLASVLQSRSAARVLDWMERTRAAALAIVDPPAVEGVEGELGALRAVHAEILTARRAGTEPGRLLARQAAIENRIRRATWKPHSSATVTAAALSTAGLRRLLDGQVLVEYDVVDGEALAVVLEPRRTRIVRLGPFGRIGDEIRALMFALRRLARGGSATSANAARRSAARRSAEHSLTTLAGVLVAALELSEHRGLVVVPVGELQRVPWSALHTQPVTVAPSASLWARTRLRHPAPGAPVVLVAGPELPGATAEIDSLRALHERATVLVPPASRVDAVIRALHGAGLVHLACHGYIRPDNPTFSSLLLSDGHLTVQELDQRAIAPHRIVLAACESGSDTLFAGNETLGFVSTLIARGTAGLVASSVVVPDWNVVPLMRSLHAGVCRGETLAQALHHARATVDPGDAASFVSLCAFNAFGAA